MNKVTKSHCVARSANYVKAQISLFFLVKKRQKFKTLALSTIINQGECSEYCNQTNDDFNLSFQNHEI